MAASIALDSEQEFYLSGDDVRGRVRYQCPSSRSIDRVEVKFWGRLKTTIVEKNQIGSMYCDRVCLFEKRLISGGKATLEPGIHNWPFIFKFPSTADARQVDKWDSPGALYSSMNRGGNKQYLGTVLPPSFQLNALGLVTGYHSFIAYAVVAHIHFSDGKTPPETAEALLEFIPATDGDANRPEEDAPNEKTYNIKGFDLLPENERPKLKKWSLSNPPKPVLRFRITASTPKYLTPTEPWRLLVNLDIIPPTRKEASIAKPPQFLLKSINIRMNSKLELRIESEREHVRIIRDDDNTGVSFENMGALTSGEPKEISMGKMRYVPATVNLSSVSRRYKLLVELEVETADHAHSFSLKFKEPVTVEPLPLVAREGGEAQETTRMDVKKTIAGDLALGVRLAATILELVTG